MSQSEKLEMEIKVGKEVENVEKRKILVEQKLDNKFKIEKTMKFRFYVLWGTVVALGLGILIVELLLLSNLRSVEVSEPIEKEIAIEVTMVPDEKMSHGFRNYEGGYPQVSYYKSNGIVHLEGFMVGGDLNMKFFCLPEKFRPSRILHFNPRTHDGSGGLRVYPDGCIDMFLYSAHNWVSLNGVYFRAER